MILLRGLRASLSQQQSKPVKRLVMALARTVVGNAPPRKQVRQRAQKPARMIVAPVFKFQSLGKLRFMFLRPLSLPLLVDFS